MFTDLNGIKKRFLADVENANDLTALEGTSKKYLGVKRGELTMVLRSLKDLSASERKKVGLKANQLKRFMQEEFAREEHSLRSKMKLDIRGRQGIDVTAPGKKPERGHLHPLTRVLEDIEDIFERMGFGVVLGPDIETEFYNFDALNIPKDHPARDLWDTFWLKPVIGRRQGAKGGKPGKGQKFLLRTHTSPVQIRYMETHEPPFRIIAPGRAFRHEATDASHHFNFYQVEGLMVGDAVSVANFKSVITSFYGAFFRKNVDIRLRPSYFPFVEPGFEVDMSCTNCNGKGCSSCSRRGWLEMMGAGMVHPNVFRAVGYNPKFVQGFAFGMGVERLAMMRYKIDDIRLFYSGDLRFLKQF